MNKWDEEIAIAIPRIMKHEGFRSKPYRDTVGKLTIGYGRNLDDVGISEVEARVLLEQDLLKAAEQFNKLMEDGTIEKHFDSQDEAARAFVLIEMIFNMGVGTFKKFKNLIAALNAKDWEKASAEMLDSKWAEQVGQRAKTLAEVVRTGSHEL